MRLLVTESDVLRAEATRLVAALKRNAAELARVRGSLLEAGLREADAKRPVRE